MAIREALIVAVSEYEDPKLSGLRAPAADARALAEVLGDPDIGGFDVETLLDPDERSLRYRLATFLSRRSPDDLLVVHFSCHGVKDEFGDLYLAARDTKQDLLSATGLASTWLNEQITRCRSKRIVVLLDCCFSGSFPFGTRVRASATVDAHSLLQGRGRAVISSSNAMEYAWEGDQLTGEGLPSVFSGAVVEGLRTGRADRDGDHWISVEDLYGYVSDRVKEQSSVQTPRIQSDLDGTLYLARSSYEPPVEPATLDAEITGLINSNLAGARLAAVEELSPLLRSPNRAMVLAARSALEILLDDDSRRVSDRASQVLAEIFAATSATAPKTRTLRKSVESKSNSPPRKAVSRRPATTKKTVAKRPATTKKAESRVIVGAREIARITHQRDVYAASFSPDTSLVVTGSRDKTARISETRTGHEIARVTHQRDVCAASFSPDGSLVVTGSRDASARISEARTGREIAQIPHDDSVYAASFSPDGSQVVTGSGDKTVRISEARTGREIARITHDGSVAAASFSPDGSRVVTGSLDKTARIFDARSGREIGRITHDGSVYAASFSPDGSLVVTGGREKTARISEVRTGREIARITHEDSVLAASFSPDGSSVVTGSVDKTARISAARTGHEIVRVTHRNAVHAVSFSPDGSLLVTGSWDKTARISELSYNIESSPIVTG
jgi:WD40 repeat protein